MIFVHLTVHNKKSPGVIWPWDIRRHISGYWALATRTRWSQWVTVMALDTDMNTNSISITVVSQVSTHGHSTITPYFSLPWALTRCTGRLPCAKLCTNLVKLARLYCVLVKAVALSLNTEASYTKLIILLPRFSCLLQIEWMHNWATIVGHAFV